VTSISPFDGAMAICSNQGNPDTLPTAPAKPVRRGKFDLLLGCGQRRLLATFKLLA
jgi:hypothetical protein